MGKTRTGKEFSRTMDPTDSPSPTPSRTPNPPQPPIQTPHHHTSAKLCICTESHTNGPMVRCCTCRAIYHDSCVGLKCLRDVLQPNDAGILVMDGWACPECIVTARLLQPGSPMFDAIASKAAELCVRQDRGGPHSQPAWGRSDSHTLPLLNETSESDQPLETSLTVSDNRPSSSSMLTTSTISSSNADSNAPRTASSERSYANVTRKLPPQPRITIHCADVKATRESLDNALGSVPISHAKNLHSSIRVWFPNEKAQKLAEEKLKEAEILKDSTRLSTAVTSKVTLRFVPVDTLPEDSTQEECRKYCLERLKAKNTCLQSCQDLSVVYFKRLQNDSNLATVALKLPVEVKDKLLADGRVFFNMSSVKVYHRVHVKRCPHCQSLGHYPDRCPNRGSPPTCMFCSKDHDTDTCPVKDDPNKHVCKNCVPTNHNEHSHHAGSVKCPTYKNEYDRLSKNFYLSSTQH